MTRDEIQLDIAKKFLKLNSKGGYFIAGTGFGKTKTALLIHKLMKSKDTIIVVPTIELKKQWESQIDKKCRVYVVNTLASLYESCDLLILDESHRYSSDFFRMSWENTKHNKLLCVSATAERSDGLEEDLLKIAPVFYEIPIEECIKNNWTNSYTMYNIATNFDEYEEREYNSIQETLKLLEQKIGSGHEAFQNAKIMIGSGDYDKIRIGKQYFELISYRKDLIYNAINKLKVIDKIINHYSDRKILVFSQTTEFADMLQSRTGDICLTVHSKMKKKEREFAIKRFKDNRTKIRVISSVKALNEGLNVPDCDIGVNAAGNSSKISQIQQIGRILRKTENKNIALFFNIYIKGTQDLYWVKNRIADLPSDRIKWSKLEF